jgi:diguanylate cyclase (GGDEF)-like protein
MDTQPPPLIDNFARIAELLAHAEELIKSEPDRALTLCEESIELASLHNPQSRKELAHGLKLRGSLLLGIPDYANALNSFSQALEIFELLDEKEQIAKVLVLIGTVYSYLGLFPDALQTLLDAEVVSEQSVDKNNDPSWLAETCNNIGYTYVMMDEPEKALPYLQKSVDTARGINAMECMAIGLDSLSNAYIKMGDFESALTNALESVHLARKVGIVNYIAEYLLTVASAYIHQFEYPKANSCIEESLALARFNNFRLIEAEALRKLGDLYHHEGRSNDAINILRQALSIVQTIGRKQSIYQCLFDLAMVCKKTGDYAAALDYFEQFYQVKSDIFSEQADWRIKNLEIAHQVAQARKEKEIYQQTNATLEKEITERKEAQAIADKLAITDSLTGLYNRRHFFYLSEREIEQAHRYNRPVLLVLLDLDHFKLVNDTHGHPTGDAVLSIFASLIQRSLRKCDIACRYGGEEFVILMPETSVKQGKVVIQRVRDFLSAQGIITDLGPIFITFSAGIADLRSSESNALVDLEMLIKRADQALYDAKHAGRNRTVVYSSEGRSY